MTKDNVTDINDPREPGDDIVETAKHLLSVYDWDTADNKVRSFLVIVKKLVERVEQAEGKSEAE